MRNDRSRRIGEEWYECDRCGITYPRHSVIIVNGLTLCQGPDTIGCRDLPGVDAFRKDLEIPYEAPLEPLPQIDEDL